MDNAGASTAFEDMVTKAEDAIAKEAGYTDQLQQMMQTYASEGAKGVDELVGTWTNGIQTGVANAFPKLMIALNTVKELEDAGKQGTAEYAAAVENLTNAWAEAAGGGENFADMLLKAQDAVAKDNGYQDQLAQMTQAIEAFKNGNHDAMDDLVNSWSTGVRSGVSETFKEVLIAFDAYRKAVLEGGDVTTALVNLDEALLHAANSGSDFDDMLVKAADTMAKANGYKDQLDQLATSFGDGGQAGLDAVQTLVGSWTEGVRSGVNTEFAAVFVEIGKLQELLAEGSGASQADIEAQSRVVAETIANLQKGDDLLADMFIKAGDAAAKEAGYMNQLQQMWDTVNGDRTLASMDTLVSGWSDSVRSGVSTTFTAVFDAMEAYKEAIGTAEETTAWENLQAAFKDAADGVSTFDSMLEKAHETIAKNNGYKTELDDLMNTMETVARTGDRAAADDLINGWFDGIRDGVSTTFPQVIEAVEGVFNAMADPDQYGSVDDAMAHLRDVMDETKKTATELEELAEKAEATIAKNKNYADQIQSMQTALGDGNASAGAANILNTWGAIPEKIRDAMATATPEIVIAM